VSAHMARTDNSGAGIFTKSTIVELLSAHAEAQGKRTALTILSTKGAPEKKLSYAELDQTARNIAVALLEIAVPEELALLPVNDGLEFVTTFLGCLYAGVIPIPTAPLTSSPASVRRIFSIVNDTGVSLLLADEACCDRIDTCFSDTGRTHSFRRYSPSSFSRQATPNWRPHAPAHDSLAFLQYTSGSIHNPLGVMVTHANIIFNMRAISNSLGYTSESVLVNWMPLHHDGGLIFMLLQALFCGAHCILMPTSSFVGNPMRWLRLISDYKATGSVAPPFGYALCSQRGTTKGSDDLKLDSWSIAAIGAETISASTIESFQNMFAPAGFRQRAFTPCYGLAEATVLVSSAKAESPPYLLSVSAKSLEQGHVMVTDASTRGSRTVVGCGVPVPGMRAVIVDPWTQRRVAPDRVGEIWLAGPGVTAGYWRQTEATRQTFHAFLADSGEGPFLRTGDMGFMHEEELFITGRLKELLIVAGENHYPQDIEASVATCHPALRPAGGAVFQLSDVENGKVMLLHEVRTNKVHNLDGAEVVREIRRTVVETHGIALHTILLLRPKSLPKTTSGKLQRGLCRELFLEGKLKPLYQWESEQLKRTTPAYTKEEAYREIETIWRDLLNVEDIGPDKSFFELGGDSLSSLQMTITTEVRLGIRVPSEYFKYPTLKNLVRIALGEALVPSREESIDTASPIPFAEKIPRTGTILGRTRAYLCGKGEAFAFFLPYTLGIRWLRWWCGNPLALPLIYRSEARTITRFQALRGTTRSFHTEVLMAKVVQKKLTGLGCGAATTSSEVIDHIKESRLPFWSTFLKVAQKKAPLTTKDFPYRVIGKNVLEPFLNSKRGLIILATHDAVTNLSELIFSRLGLTKVYRFAGVMLKRKKIVQDKEGSNTPILSIMLHEAISALREGSAVLIAGTGSCGDKTIKTTICAQSCLVRTGFAELAIHSDAGIVPISSKLGTDGSIEIEFYPPFQCPPEHLAYEQKTDFLVYEFARHLNERFSATRGISLDNIAWLLRNS